MKKCTDKHLADVFGRVEVVVVSIFFYVLGKLPSVKLLLCLSGT